MHVEYLTITSGMASNNLSFYTFYFFVQRMTPRRAVALLTSSGWGLSRNAPTEDVPLGCCGVNQDKLSQAKSGVMKALTA